MKKWRWVLVGLAAFLATFALSPRAQAQAFQADELESLLAPVALHPDAVLWNVLDASTEPDEVVQAAQWSRNNPGLSGDAAVAAVESFPWHPAVKALVAYPDLLARMAESPQWTFDLGNAYLAQHDEVLATVQLLRQRAYAGGHLQSDSAQIVQHYGSVIAVAPAVPHYFFVPYYDPIVVFGPAWRPVRHVHWRPWSPRPVIVKHVHRPVVQHVHRPVVSHAHRPGYDRKDRHVESRLRNGPPSPAIRMQREQAAQFKRYHNVPESRRQPIVQSRSHAPRVESRSHAPRFEHRGGASRGGHSRGNGLQSRGNGRSR
jgi:hypothetical protein